MKLDKTSMTFRSQEKQPNDLNIFISNSTPEPFFCQDLCNLVSYYKGFIDRVDNFKKWDYAKKLSNPFELINQGGYKGGYKGGYNGGYKGISEINPISRSYFKLLELIIDHQLIDNRETFNYGALAEGPGGFVECFIKYRKSHFLGRNDNILCMTLKSESNEIPNWNKASNIFEKNNVRICYGKDTTGNLYNSENIVFFRDQLKGGLVDLVTADGGFDYSVNFNKQEQMSARLIFSEVVCALNVNKIGGHFVLKVFDIYTVLTIKIIYLLTLYYETVIITKPHTSRPANSEKYIVCKGFKGISETMRIKFLGILDEWSKIGKKKYVSDLGGIKVIDDFLRHLYHLNISFAKIQITNILKTIVFIENELEHKDIVYLKRCQVIYALEWCKIYGNPINNTSISLY